VTRAIADTSVFVAQETGRPLGDLPDEIAVSVVTAAELELGVLRAKDTDTRARRLATLAQVRATYPLLPVDAETASCFARIAAASWRLAAASVATMPGSRRRPCATAWRSQRRTPTSQRSGRSRLSASS
jgi:predicted nucleic acid-binding protein